MIERQLWPPLRALWRRRERWNGRFLPLTLLAVLAAGGGLGYGSVARLCAERGATLWSPWTIVDSRIPALPWTLWVYLAFHPWFVLTAFAAPRSERGRAELALLFQALFAVGIVSLACFAALPCEVWVRSDPALRASSLAPLYELLHAADPPWNAWPSLHVSESLLCTLALDRWFARGRAGRRAALWAAWTAIALSTLTTKQHFVFDVLTGAWVGAAAWRWFLRARLEALEAHYPRADAQS